MRVTILPLKSMLFVLGFVMAIFVTGFQTVHAQDVWVGTADTSSGFCNVWLDTNSIKRISDMRQCRLKWATENGRLVMERYVSYIVQGVARTSDGRTARAMCYYVSQGEPSLSDEDFRGRVDQAPEHYRRALEYIDNRNR